MNIKHTLNVVLYTLAASLPLTPAIAQAQTYNADARSDARSGAATRIDAFSVGQLNRVLPGSELEFNLSGTRGAQVTLEIAGSNKVVKLEETRPGYYEGSYTVNSRDRITAASLVTARMLKDGQTVAASLDQSVVSGARSPAAGLARIAAFTVTAPERVRPGDELTFSMTGTSGAKAGVALNGVPNSIALTETSPGVYQGSYTVRRRDRPDDSLAATGFLAVNNQESTQRFTRQNVTSRDDGRDNWGDNRSEPRADNRGDRPHAHQGCTNCGVVEAVNVIEPKSDTNNVVGTIAGGLLGGVLGHQVGGGTGKDLATIAGAVGGAFAGNRVENNMAGPKQYQVTVRLDNATVQTFIYAVDPAVKVGTRVKVENNLLVRL